MTKDEFLIRLRTLVGDLPPEEREDVMHYYTEYFAEAGPENEQQVIRQLGSPEKVAQDALGGFQPGAETGQAEAAWQEEGQPPPRRKLGLGGMILALFAAPVALPLLFAGVLVAGSMGLVALCLLAIPLTIGAAFVASGVVNMVLAFGIGRLGFATVWVFFGSGLFMAAAGLLGLVFSAKLLAWGFRGITDFISGLLHRRRRPQ